MKCFNRLKKKFKDLFIEHKANLYLKVLASQDAHKFLSPFVFCFLLDKASMSLKCNGILSVFNRFLLLRKTKLLEPWKIILMSPKR